MENGDHVELRIERASYFYRVFARHGFHCSFLGPFRHLGFLGRRRLTRGPTRPGRSPTRWPAIALIIAANSRSHPLGRQGVPEHRLIDVIMERQSRWIVEGMDLLKDRSSGRLGHGQSTGRSKTRAVDRSRLVRNEAAICLSQARGSCYEKYV
jgi:hypothetical protein